MLFLPQRLVPPRLWPALAVTCGALLSASCGTSATELPADAGPSRVIWVSDSYAGGQRVLDSTVVDSLSSTWTVTRCGPVGASAPICQPADRQVTRGTVDTTYRRLLFERARAQDFVSLAADYRPSVVPPDLFTQTVHVAQNQRLKRVDWRSGAATPPALGSFICLLEVSLGRLIICAS